MLGEKILSLEFTQYSYIITCPICKKKEKVVVYREEILSEKDKIKTVIIKHFDFDPPHEIRISIDMNGHIRAISTKMLDRLEEVPLRYEVRLESFPIILKPGAIRKEKNEILRKILELSTGFNSIDDIAKELNIPRLKVIELVGILKKKKKIDVMHSFYISSEEVGF